MNKTHSETDIQAQQLSISSLSQVELGLFDFGTKNRPKPRRRFHETKTDVADGLDILIQKTKAIGLLNGEEGLGENEDGNEWIKALSSHGEKLLWGIKKVRKYVCGDDSNAHAEELIKYGVLKRVYFYLDATTSSDILFEALWIITNIAAGPTAHTTYLVDLGILMPLGNLLNHPKGNIRTQAAWAIGNIIGDREGYRDLVLQAGLIQGILDIWKGEHADEDARRESFRISMWIVDNMCRYKPDWHLMQPAFEAIPQVLQHDEPAILKECCWAVARILHQSGRHPAIDSLITPVLCSRLVEILRWNKPLTTHPILRALINLASSKNKSHLKYITNAGIITELEECLVGIKYGQHCKQTFGVFAVQILGNLVIHREFAQELALRYSLCQWLVKSLNETADSELRSEICITLRNMMYHRSTYVTGVLAQIGALKVLNQFLVRAKPKTKIQLICLEALMSLAETAPPKERVDNGIVFLDPQRPTFDYPLQLKCLGTFNDLVRVYEANSGVVLDEMEQLEQEVDELNSDSDEEPVPAVPQTIPFSVSNPHSPVHPHFNNQQYHTSNNSVSAKIVQLCMTLLRKVFPEELEAAIKSSQQESMFCQAMNTMDFGSNSKVNDLTDIFGKLNQNLTNE